MRKGRRAGKVFVRLLTLSHSILVWKLRKCVLDESNVRFECCMDHQAQMDSDRLSIW